MPSYATAHWVPVAWPAEHTQASLNLPPARWCPHSASVPSFSIVLIDQFIIHCERQLLVLPWAQALFHQRGMWRQMCIASAFIHRAPIEECPWVCLVVSPELSAKGTPLCSCLWADFINMGCGHCCVLSVFPYFWKSRNYWKPNSQL